MEKSKTQLSSTDIKLTQLRAELAQAHDEIQKLKQEKLQERKKRKYIESILATSQHMLQLVMDTLPESVFWKDRNLVYLGCNQNFADDAGLKLPVDIVGKTDFDMPWKEEEAEFYRVCDRRIMHSQKAEFGIIESQLNGDGEETWLETNKAPLYNAEGEVVGILGTYQDITERKTAEIALQELNQKLANQTTELSRTLEQLQQSQLQLIQTEKMSALGNLIAGVAHEINNPTSFLSGNLEPAKEYAQDIFELLDLYQECFSEPPDDILQTIEDIDLEYIREDLPKIFDSMAEGVKRITNISKSLRTFSRADTEAKVPFQLHEGIDSTLLILQHRLKANEQRPAIQIVRDYGDIPVVSCFPGQINQVFMNLLANAIDALDESNQDKAFHEIEAQPNVITIKTDLSIDKQFVTIAIKDNGKGMTEAIQSQIFKNSFTTKAVGKGTGLGLAIAQQIIVDKHGGNIHVASELGLGTEFAIQLPMVK